MFAGVRKPTVVVRKASLPVPKSESQASQPAKSPSTRAAQPGASFSKTPHSSSSSKASRLLHPDGSSSSKRRRRGRNLSPVSPSSSASTVSPPGSDGRQHQHQHQHRRQKKRKAPSPGLQRFSSSSEDEDDGASVGDLAVELDFGARKRVRPSPLRASLDTDEARDTFDLRPRTDADREAGGNGAGLLPAIRHSADLTMGVYAREYRPVFDEAVDGESPVVRLMYPGDYATERFELVAPIESQGYEPIEDVIQTIEHICRYYFPESQSNGLTDDVTGFSRRLKRAVRDKSLSTFTSIVEDFNKLVVKALVDGTVLGVLEHMHSVPLPLLERITSQIYSRTISPRVNILKQYENGTSNVYGELLPRFTHTIFSDTQLKSDQVFVDMGSGVGNVVLQAALEVGCESWGIEQMPNPCALAQEQLSEFTARCKRWRINPGAVHLVQGDFLANPQIDRALRRADVVLINNQAFLPELNSKIVMKLLDLKEGCKVVSLKSFVPDKWEIKPRNVEDPRHLLNVVKKEYWSGSVSWTDIGGDYFIATKDSTRLKRFLERGR